MKDGKQPLVSVLISCFNVSRFINTGLEDVVNQSYENIEIIVVDDGSTDDTNSLLNEWVSKDARVSVITHHANKGLGAARNTSLDAAKGEYVYFFDVDDRLKSDTIAYCVGEMEARQTDLMIFSFEAVESARSDIIDEVKYTETYAKSHREICDIYIDRIMLARHGNGFVWNKFYRTSFLRDNHIRFGSHAIQQDAPFNLHALATAQSLYISPYIGYRYFIYSSGNNRARFIPERLNIVAEVRDGYEDFIHNAGIDDERARKVLNNSFWSGMMKYFIYDLDHKDCRYSSSEKKTLFAEASRHPYAVQAAKAVLFSNRRIDEKAMAMAVLTGKYTLFKAILYIANATRKLLRK